MDSSTAWFARLASAFGPTDPPRLLGAGVWAVRAGGRELVVKVGPACPDEAAGLRSLAAIDGAPPVPEVMLADGDLLVTTRVVEGRRNTQHEEALGRGLAALHAAPRATRGGGSSWIGGCRVDPVPADDGADFYRRRLGDLAGRCGLGAAVAPVLARMADLLGPAEPALLHGDLWWGNVLWGADGQPWLIDPSVHGGHPEEDLAMLGLFGSVPARLLAAYCEVHPLDEGWEDRVDLFRLYPLLVHTVLYGGGYRAQAEEAARRYT